MSAGFQVLANLLDTAHRSLDFYTGQMRSLSDIESLRNEQCSVCLTPKDDLAALVMLPCSHIFHRDCVRSALETNPKCPYCRAHAPKKSMSSVLLEASLVSCVLDSDRMTMAQNNPQDCVNKPWNPEEQPNERLPPKMNRTEQTRMESSHIFFLLRSILCSFGLKCRKPM